MNDISEGSVDEQLSDQATKSAFLGSRPFLLTTVAVARRREPQSLPPLSSDVQESGGS